MRILGIDYGKRKIGLALSEGKLAEPFKVIRAVSSGDMVKKVIEVIKVEKVERVVVGISEGQMANETRNFLSAISNKLSTIKFEIFDETLTTQEAQALSRAAGIKRKRRKELEDAFAACVMLQSYIDNHV